MLSMGEVQRGAAGMGLGQLLEDAHSGIMANALSAQSLLMQSH